MAKTWVNHKGDKVPYQYVPGLDKKKERFAVKALKNAQKLEENLTRFKKQLITEADKLFAEMMKEANLKPTDRKGNYSITSFDKSVKIEVNVQNKVEFDDNINFAQEKINDYLETKMQGADEELSVLVNNAFKTTKGNLDTKRILSLFSLNIKHPIWLEAMELIKKSIQTNNSKRYVRIWHKNDEGEYESIDLNFSSI